jgi:hypothetical protein
VLDSAEVLDPSRATLIEKALDDRTYDPQGFATVSVRVGGRDVVHLPGWKLCGRDGPDYPSAGDGLARLPPAIRIDGRAFRSLLQVNSGCVTRSRKSSRRMANPAAR